MSRSTKVKFETTTVHFVRPLLGFNDDTFELAQHDADYPWFTLSVADAEFPSFITVDLAAAFTDLSLDIPDDVAADLDAEDIDALLILGIVNVADGFTVNLAGPLVVNLTAQTIAQVVQDADLPTAAPLNGGN